MSKSISSEALPLLIMAVLVCVVFAAIVSVWAHTSGFKLFFVFWVSFTILVCIFQIWTIYRTLLKVSISKKGLEIQLLRKSCFVEFKNIESVSGGEVGFFKLPFAGLIRIDFFEPTVFGKSIKFFPGLDMDIGRFFIGYQHNTVSKIKNRLNKLS